MRNRQEGWRESCFQNVHRERLQQTMKRTLHPPGLGEALLLVTLACLLLAGSINAKIYTKCELAKQLTANGISRTYQGHWICLANAVSGLDSTKTTDLPNQTHNYGIFQINSKEWCRVGYKGGKCNVKCEDLAADSITTAIQCSKLIQQQKGFNEWQLWQKKCKGKDLPDLSNCNAVG